MTETEKILAAVFDLYRDEPAGVILDADEYPCDEVNPNRLLGIELRPEAAAKLAEMNKIIARLQKSSIKKEAILEPLNIEHGKIGSNVCAFIEFKYDLMHSADTAVINDFTKLLKLSDDVVITRSGRKRGIGLSFCLCNVWKKYKIISEKERNKMYDDAEN